MILCYHLYIAKDQHWYNSLVVFILESSISLTFIYNVFPPGVWQLSFDKRKKLSNFNELKSLICTKSLKNNEKLTYYKF